MTSGAKEYGYGNRVHSSQLIYFGYFDDLRSGMFDILLRMIRTSTLFQGSLSEAPRYIAEGHSSGPIVVSHEPTLNRETRNVEFLILEAGTR